MDALARPVLIDQRGTHMLFQIVPKAVDRLK